MIHIDNRLFNILSLGLAFGPGSQRAFKIYCQMCEENCFDMPLSEALKLLKVDGQPRERLSNINKDKISSVVAGCGKESIRILPIYDADYPVCLKNIPVPPLVLFIKGVFPDFDGEPAFCIVGPRNVTEFGRKAAFSLARRLAKAGMIIVSGSASGGDHAAHAGALGVGGRSVMVTADGIITQMNSSNHILCKQILEKGCIISESFPNDVARKFSFPVRNRILSGLSLGVAVVEAPVKSGTLITASHAAEQGKDVFVVPGTPADKAYKGSNALLRDGATPLLDVSDIFTRYISDFPEQIDVQKAYEEEQNKALKKNLQKKSPTSLSKEAQLVYNNLVKPEFTTDDLLSLGIDGSGLLSALTELEMEHLIKSMPGGTYRISN